MTCYAAGFLVAVAAFLVLPLQAQAQTVQTLVSNTGQTVSNTTGFVGPLSADLWRVAQGFTTGDSEAGYTLSSVDLYFNAIDGTEAVTVSIYEADASGNPGSSLHVLSTPATVANGLNTFTALANATLDKETDYFVVMEGAGADFSDSFSVALTATDDEDSGAASGWSIASERRSQQNDLAWTVPANVVRIEIKGTVNGDTTLSTDATLSALTVNDGTTDHTIDLATTPYTVNVGNAVMTVTLTATPTHTGASVSAVTLGGTAIADIDFTDGITVPSLAEGDNEIDVTVTAEDGSATETYMVTVTRDATTTLSTDATLSALELTDGDDNTVDLDPAFASNTRFYRATVEHGVDEITVDPTLNDTNATYEIQGKGAVELTDADDVKAGFQVALAVGEKEIRVKVTAEDGTTRSYRVDVNRALARPKVTPTQGSTTSLDVSWTAPAAETTVVGYDVQYRKGDSGDFTDGPQDVTGTSTTIPALMMNTSYQVQVRMTSDKGDSEWSSNRRAWTHPPEVTMPSDWVDLVPGGLAAGAKFRLLFVSHGTRWNRSNIDRYNDWVQEYAATGRGHTDIRAYGSAFRAVGCDSQVNARVHTGTQWSSSDRGVPIFWLGGLIAADDYGDFYDGSWQNEDAPRTEAGALKPSGFAGEVLTGCRNNGDSNPTNALGAASTVIGKLDSSSGGPLSSATVVTENLPIYGLSQVFVVRTPSSDATLSALALSGVTLAPTFAPATEDYTATVVNSVMQTTVTATPTHSGATVAFKDGDDTPLTNPVALDVGDNVIKAVVTAEDLTAMKTYMVTVTREGPPTVPGTPTGLSATADGTSTIDLDWTVPTDDGGSAITGYRIEVSSNGGTSWNDRVADTDNTNTTYAHTGLSAGTTRHYRVSAINSVGTGDASSTANATTDDAAPTVPGAPTGLSATADGTSTIDLDWTVPTDDGGSAITGYRIEVSSNGGTSWNDRVADTDNTNTTYAHTGLSAGTTRHYRVSAINSVGTGDASSTANATTDDAAPTVPGAPTGLSATADGTSTIDLDWTVPTDDGGSAITGYRIEVSSNGGTSWNDRVADTDNTNTTYAHTGLSAGTTRHYRVSAINSVGTGDASNIDDATTEDAATVPGAPTSLTATASGSTRIDLDWTAPSDGGSAITGYRIEVSSNGGTSWNDRVADTDNTNTTYAHTGLSAGTTRHYRVSAINSVGTGAVSNIDDATTEDAATVPGAPTSLTATASGSTRIDLDWTAPSDGGSAITGYRIEVSSNGGTSWNDRVADTDNTNTTYAHTGLSAGTTRHYRVSAINSVGTGAVSNIDDATTEDAATVPGAPTSLTATASGSTRIDLSWTAPSDGGSAITGYRIEVSSNGGTSWNDRVADTDNTNTTYAHTGLSAGTTRHYRVSAINANGTGTASSTDNATTATTTEPLVLTVEAVKDEVTEGEPVRYRILMSRPTSGAVVASVYKYKGDFVRNPNSRVVGAINGARSWGVAYATLDDAIDEEDGSFTVTIERPGADQGYGHGEAYTIGTPSSATVRILDNDPDDTPTVPIVSVEDARVKEGPDAELVFPAKLNVAPVETARIHWQTLDGANSTGAKAGKDYVGASGTLVFSPGQTEKTIRVKVIDDDKHEGTEVMLLYLTGAENAVIDDALMKGTIEDNDAASDAADAADAADDALAVAEGLTPDEAAGALFGERRLSEARLAALDLLGNRNGRYDLGDLLAWIERCRRGEARCGPPSTGSGPPSAAGLLAAAAAGRPWRRTRRRGSGCPGRKPIRTARRRGRFAGYALATLLAATLTLSCTEGSVAPAAYVPDPGFLTVEWSGPAAHRDVGVLLEFEGPTIDAVRAPGFELYESSSPGPQRVVVAGSLRPGPLVQFRVPDRNQFALYSVRVLEVTGEHYGLRDPTEYRAVVVMN